MYSNCQLHAMGELIIIHMYSCTGEQGCCSGESTYLPPLWPGFESSVNAIQCMGGGGLRLSLVLSTFPLSSKPTIPKLNSNSIWNTQEHL